MEKSDNHIVDLVKKGEIEAFAELVRRYDTPVFNLMYRFSSSKNEAADLTQEVFCKAYERLGGYVNGRTFFPWLYTLALNHGRDWVRLQQRRNISLGSYRHNVERVEPLFPPEIVERKQEVQCLCRALAELPGDHREMLLLRYQRELSIKEIAEIFQLSESAVKMRVYRSLSFLHQCMSRGENCNE